MSTQSYVVEAIQKANYDVLSYGQRWLHYQYTDIETERQHMDQAISVIETLFGHAPIG